MDSKNSFNRGFKFEDARFFNYVPARTLDSLTDIERRDIAHTIFELQRNNPRILREIYLDNPFIADEHGSVILRRIKRRFYLLFFNWWGALRGDSEERRRPNRIADFLFLLILTTIIIVLVLSFIAMGYMTKSAIGIDLFPGMHLFCSD